MKYKAFKDVNLSTLGMGNMRLPSTNPKVPNAPIDWEKSHEILAYAYENGINYYDTAYVYNNGESERCLGAGMKRFPRESFYYADKYHVIANPDYKAVFEEQLERLQTDYIDFYLIHCILDDNVDTYLTNGCIEYFLEQKEKGRIKYLGFSSHAGLEALEKFANHHQWDFAQLQINYFDWTYGNTAKEYQILEERQIPIMVMEPVRGGRLAALTPDAEKLLKDAHPDWSIASWALRFVKSLPMVQVTLSGMSDMDQMIDNVNTFADEDGLNEEEKELLMKALDLFHTQVKVPCTECRYCTSDCPKQINIPEFLKLYNKLKLDGNWGLKEMVEGVESAGKPKDCIGCGLCTKHCPQNIHIPQAMKELAEATK